MGFFSKEKKYEEGRISKPGTRGSWNAAKRYVKKILAFFLLTTVFGVIYSQVTQAILDLAWKGHITWGTALSESLIKALQFGTLKAPELFQHTISMFMASRPFTATIEGLIPLSIYFMAQFYLVSFLVDLFDGREGMVLRYWTVAGITVAWIALVFMMLEGISFFTGAELAFNQSEIIQQLNSTGTTDPVTNQSQEPIQGGFLG